MKIKSYIIEKEVSNSMERLQKLKEIGAPNVIIESLSKEIEKLKSGNLNIGGDKELIEEEFNNKEVKKGQGGKVYIQFDGRINYFPNAKYGRFISRVKEVK